ncbi:MAG: YdbH domain-containing protein [Alphaproteobacteria bacterium]|nr:YdbH domain-containing protein [Alphaproteobacteria bacterium]
MNRFFVIFLAFGFIAIGIASTYAYFIFIPEKVEQIVVSGINRFGFENPVFGSIKRENGQIILSDVALDSEHFSTIKELRIRFSVLKFLINRHKAQDITVHGLNLTGELSEDFVPFIAGWTDNSRIVESLQNFPAGKIYVESATMDLLSNKFGGIKIRGDGQLLISGDGTVSLKARATTKQKKLSFASKIEASIVANKDVHYKAKIEDCSVDLPNIGIKRGNGTIKGTSPYDKEKTSSLVADLQLASLRWYDLPLKDVKANIKISDSLRQYTLEGSTFGTSNILWNATISNTNEDDLFRSSVTLSPGSLNDVQKFFGRNKKLGVNAYIPKALLNIPSPSIQIENSFDPQKKNIKGTLEVKYKDPAVVLNVNYHSVSKTPADIIGSIKMDKTTYRPAPEATDKTSFDLSALGNFTLKNFSTKPGFLWIAQTTVHSGTLDFGSVKIPDIQGSVLLGGSEAEQKKRVHTLDYTFPLKKEIAHKGTVFLNFSDTKKPLLEYFSLKIYGGEIKAQDPITKDGKILRKNTLDVSNINLENLTSDAQLAGIFVSGQLAGILPFEAKKGGMHVIGGLLQSQDTGIIRLSKTMTKGLFPGYTPKNIILRKALENFHYEFFEIRLDGDLNDRVMMTLNARGRNPGMKSKNFVDVNLQIETQISLLFKALMLQQ